MGGRPTPLVDRIDRGAVFRIGIPRFAYKRPIGPHVAATDDLALRVKLRDAPEVARAAFHID